MSFWKKKVAKRFLGGERMPYYPTMTYGQFSKEIIRLFPGVDTPLNRLTRHVAAFKMFDHIEEMPKLTLDQKFDLLCSAADAKRMQAFVSEAQEIIDG